MADRTGKSVRITGGMKEFVGKTGYITNKEMGMYRVRLDTPVNTRVGMVRDDLWDSKYLKTIRER